MGLASSIGLSFLGSLSPACSLWMRFVTIWNSNDAVEPGIGVIFGHDQDEAEYPCRWRVRVALLSPAMRYPVFWILGFRC
jgi:hypothetical protein